MIKNPKIERVKRDGKNRKYIQTAKTEKSLRYHLKECPRVKFAELYISKYR